MNLEQASLQNLPRGFPYHGTQVRTADVRREAVRRLGILGKTIGAISELQGDQPNAFSVARTQEPHSVRELRNLREEERETDEPITEHAFNAARELLSYIPLVLSNDVPVALLAPDGEGGLRIEWFRGERNVRVVIPSQAALRHFVYHRGLGDPAIRSFSPASVVQTLRAILLAP